MRYYPQDNRISTTPDSGVSAHIPGRKQCGNADIPHHRHVAVSSVGCVAAMEHGYPPDQLAPDLGAFLPWPKCSVISASQGGPDDPCDRSGQPHIHRLPGSPSVHPQRDSGPNHWRSVPSWNSLGY
jgi:hypothetical protein